MSEWQLASHVCNALCRDEAHAELTYYDTSAPTAEEMRKEAEFVAHITDWEVLDVRRAYEAPDLTPDEARERLLRLGVYWVRSPERFRYPVLVILRPLQGA